MYALVLNMMLLGSPAWASELLVRIEDAVRAHVAERTGLAVDDVEIQYLGMGAANSCVGEPDILIDTSVGENFRGRSNIGLTLVDQGKTCGRFRLPARISLWQQVSVAARDTKRGQVVDIVSARVSADAFRGIPVDPDDGPFLATVPIQAGAPVVRRYVRPKPAALAGDSVSLEARRGPVVVSADAKLLNDAELGETVRVANLATGTVVQGVLVTPKLVRVGGVR